MGNQYGVAGKTARETANRKFNLGLKIAIINMVGAIIIGIAIFNLQNWGAGKVLVIVLATIAVELPILLNTIIKLTKKEEKQYNRGAEGEEQVGELLSKLGSDFVIMHDVVSPYGNIDHIVYDKRGNIFMVETKSHGGSVKAWGDQLLLNGHTFEKDIVGQCQKNAIWIRKNVEGRLHLNAWITAMLVFTNAFVEFGNPIKRVHYMNKKFLLPFIQRTNAGSPAGLKLWETRVIEGPGNWPP
jgi:Mn2+/Fe2+ NRAMP family transporter